MPLAPFFHRPKLLASPCLSCGFPETVPFFDLNDIPANCTALWVDTNAARRCQRGHIRLSYCAACGLIFNREYDPQLLKYDTSYENSQEFSPSFRAYADALAERLIHDYHLRGENIVEIGSGRGEFLKRLSAGGQNRCTGYDPSFKDEGEGEHAGVRLVEDYYSERYASDPADFIC